MAAMFLWIKALHIVAVVCWFAGLFYLPRLFVYHAMSTDRVSIERFVVMERKLYRGIMWPSMIATWFFGASLFSVNASYYVAAPWMQLKLCLVVLLTAYHLTCGYFRQQLMVKPNVRSHVFYRWFNEAPVLALIIICILVVVKPNL